MPGIDFLFFWTFQLFPFFQHYRWPCFKHPDRKSYVCLYFFLSLDDIPRSGILVNRCEFKASDVTRVRPLFLMRTCLRQNCSSVRPGSRLTVTSFSLFCQFFYLLWHLHKVALSRGPMTFHTDQVCLLLFFVPHMTQEWAVTIITAFITRILGHCFS